METVMGIFDNLGDVLKQVTGGNARPEDVHAAYDQVSGAVPQATLADGIAHAFRSDETPPFEKMIANLFGQSNAAQKAGLLNRLLGALSPQDVARIAGGAGGLGAIAGAATPGTVTPQQAEQVSPDAVQTLAREAAAHDPSIMDRAADFYAEHPTLVKAVGAAALALMLSKMSGRR
jgi:hypothetical protein